MTTSFSLQGNVKTLEGARHADRDAQFRYINAQARDHIGAGDPVISVDAKKKENVGPFKKGGAEWQPKGAPEPVNVHDFIDKELGKVTPYGVYDVAGNAGWVSVGTDHDTAAFAVATIRTWWDEASHAAYPDARRLLITADGGGSNGYRTRLWKTELAAFAAETGLQITVCHLTSPGYVPTAASAAAIPKAVTARSPDLMELSTRRAARRYRGGLTAMSGSRNMVNPWAR